MKRPPRIPPIAPLNNDQSRVLRDLVEGGARIEARRTFPHPFYFTLVVPPAKPGNLTRRKHLPLIAIDTLLGLRLNEPKSSGDAIDYHATPFAHEAVARGTVGTPSHAQIDLLSEGVA